MKRLALLVGLGVAALGCGSTYDKTYQQETQRLETQERARQDAELAQQQQAYDEASRYAAVVYFPLGSSVIDERGYQELTWFAQKIAYVLKHTRAIEQVGRNKSGIIYRAA